MCVCARVRECACVCVVFYVGILFCPAERSIRFHIHIHMSRVCYCRSNSVHSYEKCCIR